MVLKHDVPKLISLLSILIILNIAVHMKDTTLLPPCTYQGDIANAINNFFTDNTASEQTNLDKSQINSG